MNNLVSAIVTSYNHAEYLEIRMESLLAQTYEDIEIIVIDDCSTDGSTKVLEKYRKNPKIEVVVLDTNGGYANASNLGVSLCKGEYIMFAECDDFSEPTQVEMLAKHLSENKGVGVAYCRSSIVDKDGKIIGDDFTLREKAFKKCCIGNTLITKSMMQKFLLNSCVIPNMSAALLKKDIITQVGGLSNAYKICADWDLWCKIATRTDFYYVTLPLNNFRTHSSTARNTFGIKVQIYEIHKLLYCAAPMFNLSLYEKFKFRINCGAIWARSFNENPMEWMRSFPFLWWKSLEYDKLSFAYLFIGFLSKAFKLVRKKFYRK